MYYIRIHSNTLVVQVCITKISIVSKCITIKIREEIKMADDNKKLEADKLQIRTNAGVTEQFKQLAQGFTNQGEALEAFISSYKEQQRKDQLPDNKAQIGQMEASLQTIKNNFLSVLEAYNNAKVEAKAGFTNQLEQLQNTNNQKDQQIADLKAKIADLKSQVENLNKQIKAAETETELISTYKANNKELKAQLQGLQNTLKQAQKNLKDTEESLLNADQNIKDQSQAIWNLETDLKVKNADLNNKDQSIKDLREQIADLKAQNTNLRENIADKDNYIKDLNNALIKANIKAKTQKNSNPNNNKQN